MKAHAVFFLITFLFTMMGCEQEMDILDKQGAPETNDQWMNVRVKFEPTIGDLLYPNIDAEFLIIAYDEASREQWRTTFLYTGPQPNDFILKNGFHHYAFEVKKWGITSKQTFTGRQLWEGRIREGVVPITFVFSGKAEPKKILYSVSYSEVNGTLSPESKITYLYNTQGKVVAINTFSYSKSTERFVLNTETDFEYVNNRVNKIESFLSESETPYETIDYTYEKDGRPSQIVSKSLNTGITTNVDLSYSAIDGSTRATYTFSNGQSFDYTFTSEWSNMQWDRTARASELCSEGVYSYDKNINPLRHLGYVDYLMRNYSINNRLTEHINYTGCAFPSLVPESYSYTYDMTGYPTVAVTHYKGNKFRTEVHYFYQ